MGFFDRFKKKKSAPAPAPAPAQTDYSKMIGSTPDQERMNEIRFNDFTQDSSLPVAFKGEGATTADIAAYKMLKNVTPEMMKDPEFVAQLNRFVGGNYASALKKRIQTNEARGADRGQIQAQSFRENTADSTNLTTLMKLQLDNAQFGNQSVSDRIMQDFGDGSEQGAQEVLRTLSTAIGPGGSASEVSDLLGIASQGMNDSDAFSDDDRSRQMTNQLILRAIAPRFAMKAHDMRTDSFDASSAGTKLAENNARFMRAINTPDATEKHGYSDETIRDIRQFSTSLGFTNGSGATTADAEANIPANPYEAKRYKNPVAAPAPAPAKKKGFFDRFKKKKTA